MKKIMTSAMAMLLLLCAGPLQAFYQQDSCFDSCAPCETTCSKDWYIGGFGGANWLTGKKHHECVFGKHKHETGYVLAASIGRTFCGGLRAEFEYAYRNNQIKPRNNCNFCAPKGHIRSNAYMLNGLWNISFCNNWCMQPFVGAGIGYATQRYKFDCHSHLTCKNTKNKNGFAWQVIAGLDYPICNSLDLSVQYRFFQAGRENLYSQSVGAGLRYNF